MKKIAISLVTVALFTLIACGGGGGGGGGSQPVADQSPATITGRAVKGPIEGAEINLFYFDAGGVLSEIVAVNAPVVTDATGAFSFAVEGRDLMGITSPLIVKTDGGDMYGQPAPVLEAIIADPLPLTFAQVSVTCHLTVPSSVAAVLLKRFAAETGLPPQIADAQQVMARVESQLNINLSADPADGNTTLAMFNQSLDQNLDLVNTPVNNPGVDEFIAYLAANLSSSSGLLDSVMDDPGNPGSDVPADFTPFGSVLVNVVENPANFLIMQLETDTEYIENNGVDLAYITATLYNAQGQPASVIDQVLLGLLSGAGSMMLYGYDYGQGQVQAELISAAAGENLIQAEFTLPRNGRTIIEQLTVTAVDLVIDSDGDGFTDGEEQMGWEIAVDTLGYGSDGDGRLLIIRLVTSDPNLSDTDGDGLNDYSEYLAGSDPRMFDTDGDGLSDYEEWTRWRTSPTSVDTDGDARGPAFNLAPKAELFDGQELFLHATSPTLEDTDGDARTDYEEIDHPTRSPLVADLPRMELEIVDDVNVELDVEYAEEAGQTRKYGTELMRSQSVTIGRSSSRTMGTSLMVGGEAKVGIDFGASAKTEATFSVESTVSFTAEASQSASQSYSQYTTDARTHTERAASGSMSMGVRLKNTGNIPYTLSQFGITARQWLPQYDPLNPGAAGRFNTVATLIPALGGGITLAPGAESSVLQIQAADVNSARIKALLARPDSLYLEPAYYELENAEGLNFAYLEEITGSRTALVTIDFGNGTTETYRVATNVERLADGSFAGIDMGTVMTHVLAIPFETRPRRFLEPNSPTNEAVLFSVRDTAMNPLAPEYGFWSVVLSRVDQNATWVDFQDVVVRAGDQIHLMFINDEDGDGLFSAEEQHYRAHEGTVDSDGDGLTDVQEIRETVFADPDGNEVPCGWVVNLLGPEPRSYPVISDPAAADRDGDGLNDFDERAHGTDPNLADTDSDGIPDSTDRHPLYPAQIWRIRADALPGGDGLTWATAKNDLRLALVDAQAGYDSEADPTDDVAEIWVASGVYKPHATIQGERFILVNDLGLFGGFSGIETKQSQRNSNPVTNATVLSGDLQGNDWSTYDPEIQASLDTFDDNSTVVVSAPDTIGQTATLDGFLITGGNDSEFGGGLHTYGLPTLRNLFFRVNHGRFGAALTIRARMAGAMIVEDCIFDQNVAYHPDYFSQGGAIYTRVDTGYDIDYQLNLRNCRLSDNEAWQGGGLYAYNQKLLIEACDFLSNEAVYDVSSSTSGQGAGIYLSETETDIDESMFYGNYAESAGGGISMRDGCAVEITQSVLAANAAKTEGGGIYGYGGSARNRLWIINSTIVSNRSWPDVAGYYGGGLRLDNPLLLIENSILWGNQSALHETFTTAIGFGWQLMTNASTYLSARTSDIEYGYYWTPFLGNGNIFVDPQLVNADNGDARLSSDSPCIDAGNNFVDFEPKTPGFTLLPETDRGGKPRIVDGNGDGDASVDMGAYEYQGG